MYYQGLAANFLEKVMENWQHDAGSGRKVLVFCSPKENVVANVSADSEQRFNSAYEIRNISFLRAIEVYYAATLSAARALTASLPFDDSTNHIWLAVYGLFESHKLIGEYSAQGIGKTIASLVECTENTILLGDVVSLDSDIPILNPSSISSRISAQSTQISSVLKRWV